VLKNTGIPHAGLRKAVALTAALTASATLGLACSSGEDDGASDESTEEGALVSITQEPSTHNVLSTMVTVEADEDVQVDLSATADGHEVDIPRTSASATTHEIPVVGLRAEKDYDIHAELVDADGDVVGDGDVDFTTGALPELIPEFDERVATDDRAPGYTFVEITPSPREGFEDGEDPLDDQHVVVLDSEGEVVWYYSSKGSVGDVRLTDRGTIQSIDFPFAVRETDLLGNGVGYWGVEPEVMPWMDLSEASGEDDAAQDRPEATPVHADWVDLRSLHHEAYPMPNGNTLALSITLHELSPEQRQTLCPGDPEPFWVISDVVVEYTPEGEVLKTWDLWDMIDVMATPGEEMCATSGQIATEMERDWGHANSVIYDEERDAIIVSTRHTSQIVAMEYGSEGGPQDALLWTIGTDGTIPLDGDVPRYQHAVELDDDGSLMFYDNGNRREGTAPGTDNPPYSRAARFVVDDSSDDPAEWTATQTWEDRRDETSGNPVFAAFLGDADVLENGNVLIDHGGIPQPNPEDDFNRCMIVEVTPDGDESGELQWDLRIGTAERPVTCYRTDRVPSLYAGPDWE